jgi:hypothetical protein
MKIHPGIRIDSIPVAGGGGLVVAVGMVVLILIAVPALRPLAAASVGGGVLLALVLRAIRR